MNIEEISHKFAVQGQFGEELFYDYYGLNKVLNLCKENRVAILGLEGFDCIGDKIIPNDAAIADFSSINRNDSVNRSIEACRDFLQDVKDFDKLIWTVVLDDDFN